jgi:hypothetical protein
MVSYAKHSTFLSIFLSLSTTMPLDKQLGAILKEVRLVAADNAYRSQITSIDAGSRLYRLGHETLHQRLNVTPDPGVGSVKA